MQDTVCQSTYPEGGLYLLKTNSNGGQQWVHWYSGTVYPGYFFEDTCSMIQTSDGGYALTGRSETPSHGSGDMYVSKRIPAATWSGMTILAVCMMMEDTV